MAQNTDNAADLYLGAGKVYIDRLDSNRARTGERYLGNCSAFEITNEDEVKDFYSSSERGRPLLKSVNTRRTPSVRIVMNEVNPDNLALAFMGSKANFAQTGASVTNVSVAVARVKQGHYFPVQTADGTHRRQISAVTVETDPGGVAFVANTDYVVDATGGRIYVVPGGGIADGASIRVDFTYATISGSSLPYVAGGGSSFIEAYLRFVGDPSAGPQMEVEVWLASLSPDGAVALLGEDYAEIPLTGKVLADTVNHPGELYRAYEIAA